MSDTDTDEGHSLRYYEWRIRQRLHWPNDVPVPLHYIDFMIEIILGPQRVSSPHNLGNFRKWAKSASRNELLIALGLVIIDRHFSRNLRNEPVYVMLGDTRGTDVNCPNYVVEMRDRECPDVNCNICLHERGGFEFKWVGPWTCPATIAPSENTSWEQLTAAIAKCHCHMCRPEAGGNDGSGRQRHRRLNAEV